MGNSDPLGECATSEGRTAGTGVRMEKFASAKRCARGMGLRGWFGFRAFRGVGFWGG